MKIQKAIGSPFGQRDSQVAHRAVVYLPQYGCWYKLSSTDIKLLMYSPASGHNGLPQMTDGVVHWDYVDSVDESWLSTLERHFGSQWVVNINVYKDNKGG